MAKSRQNQLTYLPHQLYTKIMIDEKHQRYHGVSAADWIHALASSPSRNHKEEVIKKALCAAQLGSLDAQVFLHNASLAYDPFTIFNVRQVAVTENLTQQPNPWPEFWRLLHDADRRVLTGHALRDSIQALSMRFDSTEWNDLARRVLIKDLRCGVSEKTLNRVLKDTEFSIRTFSCQLAKDSADYQRKLRGQQRLEVKLDGIRMLAFCYRESRSVCLMSRNGKIFENFAAIERDIMHNMDAFASALPANVQSFVLDGEVVGDDFQKLMRQTWRKSNVQTQNMVYHVFDIMPMQDFSLGYCNTVQWRRLNQLDTAKKKIQDHCNVRIMNGLLVDLDTAQGNDQMQRFYEEAINQGFEGIMCKAIDAPYECRRSDFWLKWKPVKSVDLTVVGVEAGTGKNAGRMGAVLFEGTDQGRFITVSVGGGWSDQDRDTIWAQQQQVIGQVGEILCDTVTRNKNGTYSLRFPRFLRWRWDKK